MERVGVSETVGIAGNDECSCSNEAVQLNSNGLQENENLGWVNDLDLYLEDINDRLIISRVVTDSVIKGVVNAVSQEATDRVAAKELEINDLNEVLSEWKMTQRLQEEFHHLIIQSTIHDLEEDNERRVKEMQSHGCKSMNWREKLKDVLSDLNVAQKSISSLEHFSSYGSLELDHFHRKVSPQSSVWENGGPDRCELNLPESFQNSNLKHMEVEQLYAFFKVMLTEMKREHESTIEKMTEDYFRLKREFLKERELSKERGPFLPSKSKDFSILKKTIPAVILKLDNIIEEDANSYETRDLLGEKLDNLLNENNRLRNMLSDRLKKAKHWHSVVSHTEEGLKKQSLDEKKLCNMVQNLVCFVEDSLIEASIGEEVNKTIIRELVYQTESCNEENKMRSMVFQDLVRAKIKSESTDELVAETIMMQEISGLVVKEYLVAMEKEMKRMMATCSGSDELIASLQSKVSDMEVKLRLGGEEKRKLRSLKLELETLVEDKGKAIMDLARNRDALILQKDNELEKLKTDLDEAFDKIKLFEEEREKLTNTIELLQQELRSSQLIADTTFRNCCEDMKSAVHRLSKAVTDFEHKTAERIKSNNIRIENSTFQLESLGKKANVLRRTCVLYKERLKLRFSDLRKAEAEVDLLGDEVDTLRCLLDKIYIALDHYSPVLQHYPGIMEILKLIRRELSGEAT